MTSSRRPLPRNAGPAPRIVKTASAPVLAAGLILSIGLVATQAGCLGLAANFMHAVGADQVPPEYKNYKEFKGNRLAVVTLTEASQYSNDAASRFLSRRIGQILINELDDIRLVREDEIEQWRDENGYDNMDFAAIGSDLKADKVIAIQVSNVTLRDGQSLYRGKADVNLQIIDAADGSILFVHDLDEFTFPENAGQHVSETTESKFEKLYLGVLAERIARLMHPYDFADTVAMDGMIAGQ